MKDEKYGEHKQWDLEFNFKEEPVLDLAKAPSELDKIH